MLNDFKSNNSSSSLGIILIIIFIIGAVYLTQNYNKPTDTFAPAGYEEGTTMSTYRTTPPNFPKDIILENIKLDSASVATLPSGKEQMQVSYSSKKSVAELTEMYRTSLGEDGWKIPGNSIIPTNPTLSVIVASKSSEQLIITIKQAEDAEAGVTFQYEK